MWTMYGFFWRSYFTLNEKTYFKFWRPISREPDKLEKRKKANWSRKMQISCATIRIYESALSQDFVFKFSTSQKFLRNDAVGKRNVEHVKHVIRMAQFGISKWKSYSWKPRRIFLILSICNRDIALQVLAIPLILRYP